MSIKVHRLYFYTILCCIFSLLSFLQIETKSFVNFFICVFLTFSVSSIFINIIKPWSVFFISSYLIVQIYQKNLGLEIGKEAVTAAMLTNWKDFKSFAGVGFFISIAVISILTYLSFKIKLKKSWKDNLIIPVLFLMLVFLRSTFPAHNSEFFFKTQPYRLINDVFATLKKRQESKQITLQEVVSKFNTKDINKNLNIVLVIGESARGDRFSLNGYYRETNPMLKKQKNIHSFIAKSCGNSTNFSVPCMLSYSLKSKFSLPDRYENITITMKKLDFSTYYYSMQHLKRNIDIFKTCLASDVCEMPIQGYDERLIEKLKNTLIQETNKPKFIILHQYGSHFKYHERFPKKFAQFSPYCIKTAHQCVKSELDNAYDNTILYTDYVLSKIIQELKQTNSVLFFTSDHGESLGEIGILGKVYGHGGIKEEREQTTVPFLIWHSETFTRKLRTNLQGISHDNLFFSILGAANVKLKDINDERQYLNIFQ